VRGDEQGRVVGLLPSGEEAVAALLLQALVRPVEGRRDLLLPLLPGGVDEDGGRTSAALTRALGQALATAVGVGVLLLLVEVALLGHP
jgi:hypothetical protein